MDIKRFFCSSKTASLLLRISSCSAVLSEVCSTEQLFDVSPSDRSLNGLLDLSSFFSSNLSLHDFSCFSLDLSVSGTLGRAPVSAGEIIVDGMLSVTEVLDDPEVTALEGKEVTDEVDNPEDNATLADNEVTDELDIPGATLEEIEVTDVLDNPEDEVTQ